MYTINVDFDVYKAVFSRRANESVSENDVLRELLGLPPKPRTGNPESAGSSQENVRSPQMSPGDWVAKNVRFPAGTEFRATYRGRTHTGQVRDGNLVIEGKPYDTPSAAAVAITGNSVNGWKFWECRLPGQSSWQMISSLRR